LVPVASLVIGEVVALVGASHPHRRLDAGVQYDLLSETESQIFSKNLAIRLDVHGQAVPVIQPPDVAAARGESLGLILERGTQVAEARQYHWVS
jgi:hypothetical protein